MVVPRAVRIIFWGRLRMPWRLYATFMRTFPVAVVRKRFLAPDFVFNLGILHPFNHSNRDANERLGMPFRQTTRLREARVITTNAGDSKRDRPFEIDYCRSAQAARLA